METVTVFTGDNTPIVKEMPALIILMPFINDIALARIHTQTGLQFEKDHNCYKAQPQKAEQIVKLLLSYNYKTRYYDNGSYKNTLFLKTDYHTGFDVESICYDCAQYNHIHTNCMQQGDRLAC